ncbi:hypothetical protein [Pseudolysinimonas sp.]|jgi:serine O-acetyltransferase|uniref:hypothetical protein n=1 Tax=Pseudolysinimonas sp. TaxID=2680009 RepID=UPI003783CD63
MIDSRDALRRYLAADLAAHGLSRWRSHYRLTKRIVYFQRLLRRSEYWSNCRRDPVGLAMAVALRLRVKLLGERMGYSIPRNTFGPGLSIAHTGTIVVNMNARVGANCRIHQGVTIGEARGRYPVIGDDAQLAPNSLVIGATLGDRVHVWPGAVVTRDFPSDSDLAGVPARVVPHERESAR